MVNVDDRIEDKERADENLAKEREIADQEARRLREEEERLKAETEKAEQEARK